MTLKAISTLLLVAITSLTIQAASADSVGATCELYRHGDAKHDRWGACSFSQRQGYMDITLQIAAHGGDCLCTQAQSRNPVIEPNGIYLSLQAARRR